MVNGPMPKKFDPAAEATWLAGLATLDRFTNTTVQRLHAIATFLTTCVVGDGTVVLDELSNDDLFAVIAKRFDAVIMTTLRTHDKASDSVEYYNHGGHHTCLGLMHDMLKELDSIIHIPTPTEEEDDTDEVT